MQKQNFGEAVDEILKRDARYERDAYFFVREGLDFTIKMLKKNAQTPATRHVSGQELLEGLRRYALDQFGPMAKTVLEYWQIRHCEDFGEIVFSMVERGILGKTDQDSREDFKSGYDFEEAFVKPFQPVPRSATAEANRQQPLPGTRRKSDAEKLSSGSN